MKKYSKTMFLKALKIELKDKNLYGIFEISYVENFHRSQNIRLELKHKVNAGVMAEFYIEVGLFGDYEESGFGIETSSYSPSILAHINQPINPHVTSRQLVKRIPNYLRAHLECYLMDIQSKSYRALYCLGF